jgi:hypothetical protein
MLDTNSGRVRRRVPTIPNRQSTVLTNCQQESISGGGTMAEDAPPAKIVMMAVESGARLLEMGDAEEAPNNFKTAC